jgi:hypothetical protein
MYYGGPGFLAVRMIWLLPPLQPKICFILSFTEWSKSWAPVIPKITVAEFKDPVCGDKVNFGIGLSYWAARLHTTAARHDNPMPELALSPESGSLNSFGYSAGIFKQYVRARNRVGIKLS